MGNFKDNLNFGIARADNSRVREMTVGWKINWSPVLEEDMDRPIIASNVASGIGLFMIRERLNLGGGITFMSDNVKLQVLKYFEADFKPRAIFKMAQNHRLLRASQ